MTIRSRPATQAFRDGWDRTGDLARAQGVDERLLIDHGAARRVDQERVGAHLPQARRVDQVLRLRVQRAVQADHVGRGGLAILAATGLLPGRDVSVIVFGDSATLRFGRPAVTAVQAVLVASPEEWRRRHPLPDVALPEGAAPPGTAVEALPAEGVPELHRVAGLHRTRREIRDDVVAADDVAVEVRAGRLQRPLVGDEGGEVAGGGPVVVLLGRGLRA